MLEMCRKFDYMWRMGRVRYFFVNEVVDFLKKVRVIMVFFGGGELILDFEFKVLMWVFRCEGIKFWFVINGENFDDEMVEFVEGVIFSIKVFDDEFYCRIMGVLNGKVIKNFRCYVGIGKFVVEMVFVFGFVECGEIERIVCFIVFISLEMRFRIDLFV